MALAHPVTILMATHNGQDHLGDQLRSFMDQTHRNWRLIVSDDGSTDATRSILRRFGDAHPGRLLRIMEGPRQGAAANFLSLLCQPDIDDTFVAFSDQDDIWLPPKIERALAAMDQIGRDRAALYGCRTLVADACGRALQASPRWTRPPSIRNALVQNIVGGHGAVINPAGLRLLQTASRDVRVPYHDWWTYIVMTACGGEVLIDPEPGLLYRKHRGNLLGNNRRAGARFRRVGWLLRDDLSKLNTANLAALDSIEHMVSKPASVVIGDFRSVCGARGIKALNAFSRAGIYRQSAAETASLRLLAALGRL